MSAALDLIEDSEKVPLPFDSAQESWIVAYADMITVLFVFFTMLLSISVVNVSKFDVLVSKTNKSSVSTLSNLKKELDQAIHDNQLTEKVITQMNHEGLSVQFRETVLFSSGKASITEDGKNILSEFVAILLKGVGDQFLISVDGHTDSRPITTKEFSSNWDLSAKRSVNIIHYLSQNGFKKGKLVLRAFADTRPLAFKGKNSKNLEKVWAMNRRVSLLVH